MDHPENVKFCKDCKHCEPRMDGFIFTKPNYQFAKCTQNKRLNPISGELKISETFCDISRDYNAPNCCGIDAQFFEAK